MNDLRTAFLSKDFVINSNIVKCISNIDITLDEFLLCLYFINVSYYLDENDIKDKLGFDDNKIISTFSSLLNKKYIELDVSNKGGEVIEKIKLDPLYDKLALSGKSEIDNSDIYSIFENELGRTLSSFEYEIINKWISSGISEELIKNALKEAILNGVRNFKYIDKIVYEWSKKDINIKSKEENNTEIFDYDWLGDNE